MTSVVLNKGFNSCDGLWKIMTNSQPWCRNFMMSCRHMFKKYYVLFSVTKGVKQDCAILFSMMFSAMLKDAF